MSKETTEVNVNVEGDTLTLLHGTAKDQKNLRNTEVVGNLNSVSRWLAKRNHTDYFKKDESYCIADTETGKLKLVVNEQDPFGNYEIKGEIKQSDVFKEIGINTTKRYNPINLANKFRLMRSYFVSHEAHATLCANLKNIKTKVNANVEAKVSDNGDRRLLFEQEVDSNMPESFEMNLPIIKGEKKQKVLVNVILTSAGIPEVDGGDIKCFLVSEDAQDFLIERTESLIEKEVKLIEKDVLVIYK